MSTLETALRGGAVAILLLSLVLRLRYARVSPVIGYSALLLLGVAAFVVDSAPGFYRLPLFWKIPIHVLAPARLRCSGSWRQRCSMTISGRAGIMASPWLWLAALAWRRIVRLASGDHDRL